AANTRGAGAQSRRACCGAQAAVIAVLGDRAAQKAREMTRNRLDWARFFASSGGECHTPTGRVQASRSVD
ncbi:hypothetical protein, partial [Falsiroseomonas sp.]|uniref:hypothetical protein n=1 Tax=Falsiroseomonas sp. TaxID=2870721 RepID=UPI0027356C62